MGRPKVTASRTALGAVERKAASGHAPSAPLTDEHAIRKATKTVIADAGFIDGEIFAQRLLSRPARGRQRLPTNSRHWRVSVRVTTNPGACSP